jgi:IS5 family transposase
MIRYNKGMKLIGRKQMAFLDMDLTEQVKGHTLYKIQETVHLSALAYRLKDLEREIGRQGYGIDVGLKALFLQFFYDLSDRQLEERLRYDLGFKWFCGFTAFEKTPDHSYFGRFRERVGTKRIGKIFKAIVNKAKEKHLVRGVFHFVDATSIVTKHTTWAERDRAIKKGEEALNNDNVKKYSADPQARFGCKGKSKFWFGYKGHVGVDMGSGLIESAALTPANVSDQAGFKSICPRNGQMVFGDKSYCLKPAQIIMKARGAISAAILKHNMIGKNKDLDRWRSSVRAPFEGLFSKCEKRARYRGQAKVQFQFFMDAIVHNVKRLVTINSPPLFQGA